MPRVSKQEPEVSKEPKQFTHKVAKQLKDYTDNIDTDKIKEHSTKLAKGVKDTSVVVGKNVAHGSVVIGKGVIQGSKIVGNGVKEGTIMLGKGTVAAAHGVKTGVEKSIDGVKHFFHYSAEKLHLKKPDLHPIDDLEEEISPYLPTELAKRWYMKNVKLKPQKGKGQLVLKWNRVFCWYEDPFISKIMLPIDDFFVCDKKKKSILNMFFVKQHQFGTITGEEGSGKTMFLHWINWELETHHPELMPCYIDGTKNVSEKNMIKQLMFPFLNIYQKTVSRPFEEISGEELGVYIKKKVGDKPFVLLIDQPQNLGDKALDIIGYLEKAGVKMQCIVAGQKDQLRSSIVGKGLTDSLKFSLDGLDHNLATEMIQKRITAVGGEGIYPFDAQKIGIICKQANGNPLYILKKAKEKVIQLSIDHREELIAQQQNIEKQKEEEKLRKFKEGKEKKRQEKEKLRQQIEEERKKHLEEIERKRIEEEEKYAAMLENEDARLDKIDELIGTVIDNKKSEEKEDKSELKKHDAVVEEAIGNIPEEKTADEILENDDALAADLKQVFEETEKANKDHHTKSSHKKKKGKK
ncbi:hypothetical protein COV16_01640 [Candidatus Woesearchaeota archaeon CG10_big_fil_rev_8_21_14_0_10_34_8]|nr:MAG: hypothetical protein COV16_01640 [Candidatus Woesearchaeota archaeon CG10_big_fil_rev_8_21_14_0_10_34_8]